MTTYNFNVKALTKFLQQVGIIQVDFPIKEFEKWGDDENECIFFLSNYFSEMKPMQFFEMSKNIVQKWITKNLNQRHNESDIKENHNPAQSQDKMQDVSINKSKIHDKLYNNAFEKTEFITLLDRLKQKNELKDCTFSPQINKSSQFSNKAQDRQQQLVFDRLSKEKDQKNYEIAKSILKQKEMNECTFIPKVLSTTNIQSVQNQQESQPKLSPFERLYKNNTYKCKQLPESENNLNNLSPKSAKNQLQISQQKSQQQKVQNDVNQANSDDKQQPVQKIQQSVDQMLNVQLDNSNPAYERLYRHYFAQQNNLLLKNYDVISEEQKQCPFKPNSFTQNYKKKRADSDYSPAYERLYQQYQQHQSKLNEKIEEKKQQLESQIQNPKINQKSSLIQSPEPAFDRLYKQGTKKKERMVDLANKVLKQTGCTFKPQLNNNQNPNDKKKKLQRNNSAEQFTNIQGIFSPAPIQDNGINNWQNQSTFSNGIQKDQSINAISTVYQGQNKDDNSQDFQLNNGNKLMKVASTSNLNINAPTINQINNQQKKYFDNNYSKKMQLLGNVVKNKI